MSLVNKNGSIYIGNIKLNENNCLDTLLAHFKSADALKLRDRFLALKSNGIKFIYKQGYLYECLSDFMYDHKSWPLKNLNLDDDGFFVSFGEFQELALPALKANKYVYILNDLEIARLAIDRYMSFYGQGNQPFDKDTSESIEKIFPNTKIANIGFFNRQLIEVYLDKNPKATKPKATKPKATKPKATKPKATKPKATKPKATKPKATKPKATKPKATKAKTKKI